MNRITVRDEFGNADIIGFDSAGWQLNLEFDEFSQVTEALNRLADYEDTELEPSEIAVIKKSQRWIPVSERLPMVDKYGDVNVMVCMDDEFIATATYDKNNGWELWEDSGEVTHWMPLPDAPKKE